MAMLVWTNRSKFETDPNVFAIQTLVDQINSASIKLKQLCDLEYNLNRQITAELPPNYHRKLKYECTIKATE